jgi:hypothetical protein
VQVTAPGLVQRVRKAAQCTHRLRDAVWNRLRPDGTPTTSGYQRHGHVATAREVRNFLQARPSDHGITVPAAAVADGLCALIALGFMFFNFMPQRPQLSNRTERLATEAVPVLRKIT